MRALKDRVHIAFPKGEGKTEQAHARESDINQIMARAIRGESSDYIKEFGGRYGDATSIDFFNANIIVANANQMFDALPSDIRNKFQNQPGKFLDFVQDPANADELVELKLANKPKLPHEVEAEKTTPEAVVKPEPTIEKPEAATAEAKKT